VSDDNSTPLWFWPFFAIGLVPIVVPLIMVMFAVPVIGGIVGLLSGSAFIVCVVRWVNRRTPAPPSRPDNS
jgi:hypothetical protein